PDRAEDGDLVPAVDEVHAQGVGYAQHRDQYRDDQQHPGRGERLVGQLEDRAPVVDVQGDVQVELGELGQKPLTHLWRVPSRVHREDVEVGGAAAEVRHVLDAGQHGLASASEVDDHASDGEVLEAVRRAQRDRVAHPEAVPVQHGVRDQDGVAALQSAVTANSVAMSGDVLEASEAAVRVEPSRIGEDQRDGPSSRLLLAHEPDEAYTNAAGHVNAVDGLGPLREVGLEAHRGRHVEVAYDRRVHPAGYRPVDARHHGAHADDQPGADHHRADRHAVAGCVALGEAGP